MDYRCTICLSRLRVTSGSSALAPDDRCPVCASSLEKAPAVFTRVHHLVALPVAPESAASLPFEPFPEVSAPSPMDEGPGEPRTEAFPAPQDRVPLEGLPDPEYSPDLGALRALGAIPGPGALPGFEPEETGPPPAASDATGRRRFLGLVLGGLAGGVGAGGLVLAPFFLGSEVPWLGTLAAGAIAAGAAAGFLLAPRRRN